MVGANYMGGKRNTARAKSKDFTGRTQRRHFGKQRLVSALRVTQENHVHRNAHTLSSVLPRIALAHARNDEATDCGTTSLREIISGNRLYAGTPLSGAAPRKKPSKILGVLETLDHASTRAAIDRLLQQPDLVGISRKESAYMKRMQSPAVVKPQAKVHLDSVSPDTWIREKVSTHVFDTAGSYPEISQAEHAGLYGTAPNLRYRHTQSDIFSTRDSPSGNCEVTPWDTHCGKSDTFSDAFGPLPWSRSLPLYSSPQSSDNSIIDLDTSPCDAIGFGRPEIHSSREDRACVDASESSSDALPVFCRSSWSFSSLESAAGARETWKTPPLIDLAGEETEAERVCAFPSTKNSDYRHMFPGEYGCDGVLLSTGPESTQSNVPGGVSVDFLSDPHPWETIGRILKLVSTEPSTTRSVDFTKDREGVGYVSEGSRAYDGLYSHASSFETGIDAKHTDDIHAVSSPDRSMLEIADLDHRMVIDTTEPPNATPLLFNGVIPSTAPNEVNDASLMLEAPSTPPIYDTHMQPLFPNTTVMGTALGAPDADMTFAGPCLFGDSDLEEDG